MNCLVSFAVVVLSIAFAIVGGRSASIPETKGGDSQNVIVLEVANAGESSGIDKAVVDGDKILIEGKNFTGLKEIVKNLGEDKKGKELDSEAFSIVVPIARNFSSLKELFEILKEDSQPHKTGSPVNLTYVKDSEHKGSEYTIFFTD